MEYAVVTIVALLVAGMALYSGFGLGTLLVPAFAIFFPVPVAIASAAIVHFANNVFRIGIVGRHANWRVALIFGLPAATAAIGGAFVLTRISDIVPVAVYHLGAREFSITVVKLVIAALIAGFAALELTPAVSRWQFDQRYLPVGGVVSGFFGGLSGHQGALRSAFLARAGLDSAAFVGTSSVAAFMVDVSRLGVYGAGTAPGELFRYLRQPGSGHRRYHGRLPGHLPGQPLPEEGHDSRHPPLGSRALGRTGRGPCKRPRLKNSP